MQQTFGRFASRIRECGIEASQYRRKQTRRLFQASEIEGFVVLLFRTRDPFVAWIRVKWEGS